MFGNGVIIGIYHTKVIHKYFLMNLKGKLETDCPQLKDKIWYDKDETPDTENMRLGVRKSEYFLLYLTEEVLMREFCRKEIRWALHYRKKIVLVWKQDGSGAVASFGNFYKDTSKTLKKIWTAPE